MKIAICLLLLLPFVFSHHLIKREADAKPEAKPVFPLIPILAGIFGGLTLSGAVYAAAEADLNRYRYLDEPSTTTTASTTLTTTISTTSFSTRVTAPAKIKVNAFPIDFGQSVPEHLFSYQWMALGDYSVQMRLVNPDYTHYSDPSNHDDDFEDYEFTPAYCSNPNENRTPGVVAKKKLKKSIKIC